MRQKRAARVQMCEGIAGQHAEGSMKLSKMLPFAVHDRPQDLVSMKLALAALCCAASAAQHRAARASFMLTRSCGRSWTAKGNIFESFMEPSACCPAMPSHIWTLAALFCL